MASRPKASKGRITLLGDAISRVRSVALSQVTIKTGMGSEALHTPGSLEDLHKRISCQLVAHALDERQTFVNRRRRNDLPVKSQSRLPPRPCGRWTLPYWLVSTFVTRGQSGAYAMISCAPRQASSMAPSV